MASKLIGIPRLHHSLYIMTPEDDSESIVVFCQPNAGYYEYMYYEVSSHHELRVNGSSIT